MDTNMKPKSFWEKPEGTTGMIFVVAICGAGGFLLYKMLPFILTLLQNTLHAILLLCVIGAILFVAFDKRFRTLIWYGYKTVMKWVTGIFVTIDPIAILEVYIDDLKDNLQKMDKQVGNLKGQMRKLKNVIESNMSQIKSNLAIASKAKEKGKKSVVILQSRKAGRLKDSNVTLKTLHTKMEMLYRVLNKMRENASFLLEDIQDEVSVKKMEYDTIKASHSALKSAMSIINGDKDKKAMFDLAMETMADDVGRKVGEMEHFMEVSGSFMDSIDLQNGVFEEEGMAMLEKWEQESDSFLLGDSKKEIIDVSQDDDVVLDFDEPLQTKSSSNRANQYSSLFN